MQLETGQGDTTVLWPWIVTGRFAEGAGYFQMMKEILNYVGANDEENTRIGHQIYIMLRIMF